jgi:RND family efflux transporter MFP subunit
MLNKVSSRMLLVAYGLLSCYVSPLQARDALANVPATGLTSTATSKPVSKVPSAPGIDCMMEPNRVIDVGSAVRGVLSTVEVDRGDVVEEGQIVARLDSRVEQAALELAKARARGNSQVKADKLNAEFAARRNERVGTLYHQNVISGDQFDEAATSAKLRELQLQQANENQRLAQLEARQAEEILNRHIIKSPVRGVVVHRYLSPGESPEERPVLRIAEIQTLRVEALIPVASFGTIKVGQRAVIAPEAPLTGYYVGTVAAVDRVVDAASGTFRARVSLPNPDYALPSGLRCSVRFLQPNEAVADNVPMSPITRPTSRLLPPLRLTQPQANSATLTGR